MNAKTILSPERRNLMVGILTQWERLQHLGEHPLWNIKRRELIKAFNEYEENSEENQKVILNAINEIDGRTHKNPRYDGIDVMSLEKMKREFNRLFEKGG